MKRIILPLLLTTLLSCPALSAEQNSIALHGTTKYGADFKNFEYVDANAPKGGTLNLSTLGPFDSLNPFVIKGSAAPGLALIGQSLIYDSLMVQSYDEPFSMYGLIAEKIDLSDDHKQVSFIINKQAKWQDGNPITAADVEWTFNTLVKDGAPFYKAYYADVVKITAEGSNKITFHFKNADNKELPLILAQMPVLPKHYWEGKDFKAAGLAMPMGSGAYTIESVKPGQSITYKRNENYWAANLPVNKGRYNFDTIRYTVYRDQNVALEGFFAGQFDVNQENVAKLWHSAYNAPAVQSGKVIKKIIPNENPAGMQAFIYNIRKKVFQDIEVRKALAYAFDFEWSNKQFAYGSYKRTKSYFENSELAAKGLPTGKELELLNQFKGQIPEEVFTKAYAPPVTDGTGNLRENLKTAAALLEAAGYKTGEDGIRVHEKTGQRLSFEIIDANPAFERWILPFVKNLKRIGVEAKYRVIDEAQYQNRMQNFDFDMTSTVISQSDSPGNEQREYWKSDKADTIGSRNLIGIKDKAVDALVEKLVAANSREELVTATKALDRVLLANHYVIPQWYFGAWRLAWWEKLAQPKKLSGSTPGITDTWYSKTPKKAEQVKE